MGYVESYLKLNEAFGTLDSVVELDDVDIHKFEFHSLTHNLLPGNESYRCESHNLDFEDTISYFNDIGTIEEDVQIKDVLVEENRNFNYCILKPKGDGKVKKVIFLFHGLNERNWDKYLPWGKAICERTQCAIVFFPIAFHMQRAPLQWAEKRQMFELSEKRKKRFPNIIYSTLLNVAISMRLHAMPQRIIWSGLQTYCDVIQFIEDCKKGQHPLIDKDFSFDFFAYSIGGLLAEILKLANHKDYFSESKVCLFCSGAVLNRMTPASKFILDSEANVAIYSYFAEHLDTFLKKDALLHHYMEEGHFEGKVFHSMLEFQKMREFRESLFRKAEKHFYAIALKKDTVIPPFEVINTLQGAFRDIDIAVDQFDFDYKYSHEAPFPVNSAEPQKVEENFNRVFDKVGEFFNNTSV